MACDSGEDQNKENGNEGGSGEEEEDPEEAVVGSGSEEEGPVSGEKPAVA